MAPHECRSFASFSGKQQIEEFDVFAAGIQSIVAVQGLAIFKKTPELIHPFQGLDVESILTALDNGFMELTITIV